MALFAVLPHRARALEVLKLPENNPASPLRSGELVVTESDEPASAQLRFAPTVIRGDFKSSLPGATVGVAADAIDLPMYGKIAAGTPIEALRDQSNMVSIPSTMLGLGEHYALTVEGDSMIERRHTGWRRGHLAAVRHRRQRLHRRCP